MNQGYIWETCSINTVWDYPELPSPRPIKHGSRKLVSAHNWLSEPPNKELGDAENSLQFSAVRYLSCEPRTSGSAVCLQKHRKKEGYDYGVDPSLIDFLSSDFAAFPGLSAEKVLSGITAAEEGLKTLGYDAQHCLIDFGQTAETVVTAELQKQRFDCILIGAGVRAVPSNFILFEKLINVIHEQAPNSKICFNTNPSDTLEALQRWI